MISSLGTFAVLDPELGFDLHRSTLAAVRDRTIQLGVASARAIDALIAALDTAGREGKTAWVTTPAYLDLALRKPA